MFKNKVERDKKEKIRGTRSKSKARINGEQDMKSSHESSSKFFSDTDDDEDTPTKVI